MSFDNKFFPYPVIRPYQSDYLSSTFNSDVSYQRYKDEIELRIEVYLDNTELKREIEKGNLVYLLHLEESETSFRETYEFSKDKINVIIPNDKVRKKIDINVFLLVKKNIIDFKSSDLDEIYDMITINYEKYNIIGYSESHKLNVIKERDEIENIKSIFVVTQDETIEERFKFELSPERVVIKLSEKDYQIYNQITQLFKIKNIAYSSHILITLIIIPVFVEVLNRLKDDQSSYSDYIWFKSIVDAYKNKDINIEEELKKDEFDAYEYTQIIFEKVLNNSLYYLDKSMKGDANND